MLPIKDHQSSGIFPIVTVAIVIITVFVFAIEIFSNNLESFIYKFALVPSLIDVSEIHSLSTFVSSIFLHAGFAHLIFNMWFLTIFGDNVEAALGKINFILFYLSGGAVASLTQYLFLTKESIPILGASGAIAAVLGFYLVKFPHHTIKTLIPYYPVITTVDLPSQIVIGLWFVTQILNGAASLAIQTTASFGIAWWAHIGGFVYGAVVGVIFTKISNKHYG